MGFGFGHVQVVAVNIDGVLLSDSFGPVIHQFVVGRGGVFSAGLERAVLSQSQVGAAGVLGSVVPGLAGLGAEEVRRLYFREREEFVRRCPVRVEEGVGELLVRLRAAGASVVCYGGLRREHFDRYLGRFASLFDGPGYVCTDGFRPGVREIAEVFGVGCGRVLFIDDVARVGEAARDAGAAFIGRPSSFVHSFQRRLMAEAGVRHVVGSLGEIDERLLRVVDAEAAAGLVWGARAGRRGERVPVMA
ncbi:HAD family hydrolase [Streptomyces asoensis]|uniref:HAD family hydrolase n=1 Tax=Streptomyces asoensis TaxID=249586 RepID=UPI001672A861|nr:HAD family hydrolase [Streptomyces asoensis]GGQ66510.1 hypothetical protein GCM10010496_32580 [Streptomyces asoensis]